MPFVDTDEMLHGAPLPGWSGRFFHSEHMTFAQWDISDGAADLHEHDHVQEEVWNIVEGEIVLVVGDAERRLGPGMAAIVPPHTRHAAKVVGRCRAIIADYPVRADLPSVNP